MEKPGKAANLFSHPSVHKELSRPPSHTYNEKATVLTYTTHTPSVHKELCNIRP